MKLKKLVKKLNKYLEENPQNSDLKITVGKMGCDEYKERSLFLNIKKIKRNKDNTYYNPDFDEISQTNTTLSIGEI